MDWTRIGSQLRELRSQQRLTQRQVAERAGIEESYVSLLESGQRNPTVDTLEAVVHAVGGVLVLDALAVPRPAVPRAAPRARAGVVTP